jgi:hypothetical protein
LVVSVLDDTTVTIPAAWRNTAPPRRLRGLRMPVIPTGSWLAQVGGGVAALVGTYLQFGLAVTLIAGGLAAVVLGTLREAGKI